MLARIRVAPVVVMSRGHVVVRQLAGHTHATTAQTTATEHPPAPSSSLRVTIPQPMARVAPEELAGKLSGRVQTAACFTGEWKGVFRETIEETQARKEEFADVYRDHTALGGESNFPHVLQTHGGDPFIVASALFVALRRTQIANADSLYGSYISMDTISKRGVLETWPAAAQTIVEIVNAHVDDVGDEMAHVHLPGTALGMLTSIAVGQRGAEAVLAAGALEAAYKWRHVIKHPVRGAEYREYQETLLVALQKPYVQANIWSNLVENVQVVEEMLVHRVRTLRPTISTPTATDEPSTKSAHEEEYDLRPIKLLSSLLDYLRNWTLDDKIRTSFEGTIVPALLTLLSHDERRVRDDNLRTTNPSDWHKDIIGVLTQYAKMDERSRKFVLQEALPGVGPLQLQAILRVTPIEMTFLRRLMRKQVVPLDVQAKYEAGLKFLIAVTDNKANPHVHLENPNAADVASDINVVIDRGGVEYACWGLPMEKTRRQAMKLLSALVLGNEARAIKRITNPSHRKLIAQEINTTPGVIELDYVVPIVAALLRANKIEPALVDYSVYNNRVWQALIKGEVKDTRMLQLCGELLTIDGFSIQSTHPVTPVEAANKLLDIVAKHGYERPSGDSVERRTKVANHFIKLLTLLPNAPLLHPEVRAFEQLSPLMLLYLDDDVAKLMAALHLPNDRAATFATSMLERLGRLTTITPLPHNPYLVGLQYLTWACGGTPTDDPYASQGDHYGNDAETRAREAAVRRAMLDRVDLVEPVLYRLRPRSFGEESTMTHEEEKLMQATNDFIRAITTLLPTDEGHAISMRSKDITSKWNAELKRRTE